ncbi:hypothetical protein [Streptomyces sp. NPDC005438]|uniref:hypothetical protein n=1 Tax=Streptomyces sp. NPDC005438 TaxID=3156880 RepID=UPI0033BE4725
MREASRTGGGTAVMGMLGGIAGGVGVRLRRVSSTVWWCAGVGATLCLVAAVFVVYEQYVYGRGHAYGEREAILTTHVFDGPYPGGDVSSYAELAEQECVEHGASDGQDAESPKWVQGCVDAVLRR